MRSPPMKSICQRFGTLLLTALICLPAVAEEFSRLEDEMSSEDFERSGLKQLSEAELEHLNAWLRRNLELADLPPEAQVTSIVAPPEPAHRHPRQPRRRPTPESPKKTLRALKMSASGLGKSSPAGWLVIFLAGRERRCSSLKTGRYGVRPAAGPTATGH